MGVDEGQLAAGAVEEDGRNPKRFYRDGNVIGYCDAPARGSTYGGLIVA